MARTRVAFPGTISSGDSVSATNNNKIPGGKIGADGATANHTGITTTYAACSVTVTVGTGREIDIEVNGTAQSDTVGDTIQVTIREDGSTLLRRNWVARAANEDVNFSEKIHSASPSAGSHTYDLLVGVNGSGPTVALIAAATKPCMLYVYDTGPTPT